MKSMVYIKNYNKPEVDKKEALRYAGCKDASEEIALLLDSCIDEIFDEVSFKLCYSRFPVSLNGDEIDLGFTKTRSHSLAVCLDGCEEIILFCATIGHSIDRIIAKYNITSPSRATMLQALGSERVESLCDLFCLEMAEEEEKVGRVIRPRFSPGYGDLSLEIQKDVFASLDCTRRIGVSLNDSLFMQPTKSVTAIIGVKGK